ncbi:MAG: PAS domain-containing protein [Lentisphaerae bacterium]|nr:PAS domain-containing protein [Lentisphaerota bacterium]
MKSTTGFLDRLIERMDRLDPASLQTYVLRLVREKGFLETVFNTIREGVIVIDQGRRIRFINSGAKALLGIAEEAGSQRIDRYLREVDWSLLLSADPEQWHRVSRQEIEVFYPRHRYLSFYVVPVNSLDSDSNIPLATLIFHDITAAHEDTEKHVESRRVEAITMLAAGVAHELGNPLNSLTIHLQLLGRCLRGLNDAALRQETEDLLAVAVHEVARLDGIVANFLHAVRPVPLTLVPLEVRSVLESTLSFMRQEIENRAVHVQAVFPDHIPRVLGDAAQLHQAFYNLIKNAVQAMSGGGQLQIVCSTRPDFLDVRFVDTGAGISAEQLTHIMDPYYTTKAEGTGLGLLIVERIVRGHGGELGITSEAGAGTVFTVSLPLRERQVRLLESRSRAAPSEDAAGPEIRR